MSRRIEIELTSQRDANTWTWRATGAKEPKGVLDAALLPADAKQGDHLRAEAEFDIDGIVIAEVLAPKRRSGQPTERIEFLGAPEKGGEVTTKLLKKKEGRSKRRSRDDRRDGGGRGRDGDGKSRGKDDRRQSRDRDGDGHGRDGGGKSRGKDDRRQSRDRDRDGDGHGRDGGGKSRGKDDRRQSRDRDRDGARRRNRDVSSEDKPRLPKAPRLRPRQTHRKAFIESLPAEQQVVAEQLMGGGIATVRKEIEKQKEAARKSDGTEINTEALLRLAESLLSKLRQAEWSDRADAAIAGIDKIDLRDLRAVLVAAEDFARTDETKKLAEKVRTGLTERLDRSQAEWHEELRRVITEGRVVRALRLSSRPPKPGVPLPPELAKDLTEQANAALGTGTTQQRLAVVLDAVAYSPVRPYVILPNVPAEPTDELVEAVTRVARRIPEIAKQLGIEPLTKRDHRRKPPPPPPSGVDASNVEPVEVADPDESADSIPD